MLTTGIIKRSFQKSKNKILSHEASEGNILLESQTKLYSILSTEEDSGCLQGGPAAPANLGSKLRVKR